MSPILAKQVFNYPGLRDLITISTPAANPEAIKFLDNYMQQKGLVPLGQQRNPSGIVLESTYQAQKPFNFSALRDNQKTTIAVPDGMSAINPSLSDQAYDRLHRLKTPDGSDNLFRRFAGQLTSSPEAIEKQLVQAFIDGSSYLRSDEAPGLLSRMRQRLVDAAGKTGAKLLFVESIPGGGHGKYLPTGRGTGQPTILVATPSPEQTMLGKKFFGAKFSQAYPQEMKDRLAEWQQTYVGFHELGHHLSNIHRHNEAGLADVGLLSSDGTAFVSPSHTARELHAEPVAAYITQGRNPIVPENVPKPLQQLAIDSANHWLYNHLPAYSGPTPIPSTTGSRFNIPSRESVLEEEKPRIRRSAAEVHSQYLARPDYANQVLDSVNYYRYR